MTSANSAPPPASATPVAPDPIDTAGSASAIRKVVFLDVDGTLVNDRGLVPASARQAVIAARAKGHLVFLCTGRSLAELFPDILEIGFDGVIAAAGGYIEVGGTVLSHRSVPIAQVRHVMEFFDAHGINYFLESNAGLFGSTGIKAQMRHLLYGGITDEDILAELERGLGPFIDSLVVGADMERHDINKVSFLDSPLPIDAVRAEFSEDFTVIPTTVPQFGPNSGELSIPGIHKAGAIQELLDHLGIPVTATIAYGDGHNDLEMLEFVNIGVAMGNATDELKAIADEITGTHDEDGIASSFAKHGLT